MEGQLPHDGSPKEAVCFVAALVPRFYTNDENIWRVDLDFVVTLVALAEILFGPWPGLSSLEFWTSWPSMEAVIPLRSYQRLGSEQGQCGARIPANPANGCNAAAAKAAIRLVKNDNK